MYLVFKEAFFFGSDELASLVWEAKFLALSLNSILEFTGVAIVVISFSISLL